MDTTSLADSRHYLRPDTLEESPHGCYEGWVYLGFEGEDQDGNPVEVIERVACRRCLRTSSDLAAENL
jgi:hypothetical protein